MGERPPGTSRPPPFRSSWFPLRFHLGWRVNSSNMPGHKTSKT
jgi:hypothetical protein